MPSKELDKIVIVIKALQLIEYIERAGLGRNQTTRLALRLVARLSVGETAMPDGELERELEFLLADDEARVSDHG